MGCVVWFGVVLVALLSFFYVNEHFLSLPPLPPGSLYSVGYFGDQMHIKCVRGKGGERETSVLVVLHSGMGLSLGTMSLLQDELVNRGYDTCSFDRLGVGFSMDRTLTTTPTLGSGVPVSMMRDAIDAALRDLSPSLSPSLSSLSHSYESSEDGEGDGEEQNYRSEIHVGFSLGGSQARVAAADERVIGFLFTSFSSI